MVFFSNAILFESGDCIAQSLVLSGIWTLEVQGRGMVECLMILSEPF